MAQAMAEKKVETHVKRVKEVDLKLNKALSVVTSKTAEMEAMKKQRAEDEQKFSKQTKFFGKITLCLPVICLKNTLPVYGLKIGTLPTWGYLHLSPVTHLC